MNAIAQCPKCKTIYKYVMDGTHKPCPKCERS